MSENEKRSVSSEPKKAENEIKTEKKQKTEEASPDGEGRNGSPKNVFVESLEHITRDDLGAPLPKKKRTKKEIISDVVSKLVFWAAVAAFFIAGGNVVYKLAAYKQAENIYKEAQNFAQNDDNSERLVQNARRSTRTPVLMPVNSTRKEGEQSEETEEVYDEQFELLRGKLAALRRDNPEVIGWIRMTGETEIDYPIVQHEDNDYYLHHAYNGKYNPAGAIFLDCQNSLSFSQNRNTIIYGHNMENGSPMFARLLNYQDPTFYQNNHTIEIFTQEALYTFEVFASYEYSGYPRGDTHPWVLNFRNDNDFYQSWINAIRERSDISPKIPVDISHRILTLSTCTNLNDRRYIVHAKLVSVVK